MERAIFGKVRYMNAAGLKRKFDMVGYVRRVAELTT
jgi:deoxyribodipyrimidine photo-lyase